LPPKAPRPEPITDTVSFDNYPDPLGPAILVLAWRSKKQDLMVRPLSFGPKDTRPQ